MMADDFLFYDEICYDPSHLMGDMKDLQRLQIIRGRFIHFTSIIEEIMKEKCGLRGSKHTLRGMMPQFIEELKKIPNINPKDIKEVEKNLKRLSSQRDRWAHALVWYKKRKKEPKKSNNLIGTLKPSALRSYFDKVNERFTEIFNFLERNNLLEIGDKKLKKYQVKDELYDPIIV